MDRAQCNLRLTVDSQPFLDFLAELQLYVDLNILKLPFEIVDSFVSLRELPDELVLFKLDDASTTSANELRVLLYPSDRLLNFSLALRAGQVDSSVLEHAFPPFFDKS